MVCGLFVQYQLLKMERTFLKHHIYYVDKPHDKNAQLHERWTLSVSVIYKKTDDRLSLDYVIYLRAFTYCYYSIIQ